MTRSLVHILTRPFIMTFCLYVRNCYCISTLSNSSVLARHLRNMQYLMHTVRSSAVDSTSTCIVIQTVQYINKDEEECVFHTRFSLCNSAALIIISLSSQPDNLLTVVTELVHANRMSVSLVGKRIVRNSDHNRPTKPDTTTRCVARIF